MMILSLYFLLIRSQTSNHYVQFTVLNIVTLNFHQKTILTARVMVLNKRLNR
ncbi:hypothetical protein Gotur_004717 [Gossypium turneri]